LAVLLCYLHVYSCATLTKAADRIGHIGHDEPGNFGHFEPKIRRHRPD